MLRYVVFIAIIFTLSSVGPARSETVTLFAASSTSGALEELKHPYETKSGDTLRLSFASSSTLSRQISLGAPADLFLSANSKWADVLEAQGLVAPHGRSELLGNSLVLAAPLDGSQKIQNLEAAISDRLGDGRLAMGDPNHVPAGLYGKAVLERMGLWARLKDKTAPTANVRAALALIERGEVPLGLVYASDAATSSKVKVVYAFPLDVTPHISYPLVIVKGGRQEAARRLVVFLHTPEAKKIFKRHGFVTPQ